MDLTFGVAHRQTATHVYFVGGPFSQWAKSPFSANIPAYDGNTIYPGAPMDFGTAEQYMMASKARVFDDYGSLYNIMNTNNPREQKQFGREVVGFDVDVWNKIARDIVFIGNWYKFKNNPDFGAVLDATGDRVIVEGAHYDPIWGVKLAWDDPLIEDETNWQGTNWLGQVCMAVRELRRRNPDADPWTEIPDWS